MEKTIVKLGNNISNFKFFVEKKEKYGGGDDGEGSRRNLSPLVNPNFNDFKRTDATGTSNENQTQKGVSDGNADDGYSMTKWRQERIWIEAIESEHKSIEAWNEKWAFLADYDQKGNLKEKVKLPDRVNMYSDKIPSSCGHMYGYRLDKDEAKIITSLENQLSTNYKKQKNTTFICYD